MNSKESTTQEKKMIAVEDMEELQKKKSITMEDMIQEVVNKKMADGTVEKIIEKKFEEGVNKALEEVFGNWGDATKIITKKVKEVMIPFIEQYNYSEYIVKLDKVLVEVLKQTTFDNITILENFKTLMAAEKKETITLTEIFNVWVDMVAKEIDSSKLEINFDDGPHYNNVNVSFCVNREPRSSRSYSSIEYATINFECEEDDEFDIFVDIYKWKDEDDSKWRIDIKKQLELTSLRYVDDFQIFLMQLSQFDTKITIDKESDYMDAEVEAEPEATFI